MKRIDPRKDPSRRMMPLREWPRLDRALWEQALGASNLIAARPICRWSPRTRETAEKAYGRYLTWCAHSGGLDPQAPIIERVTPSKVVAYVEDLLRLNRASTVRELVRFLHHVAKRLAPDHDWTWLRKLASRIEVSAPPWSEQLRRMRSSDELLALGLRLCDDADSSFGLLAARQSGAIPRRSHDRAALRSTLAPHQLRATRAWSDARARWGRPPD